MEIVKWVSVLYMLHKYLSDSLILLGLDLHYLLFKGVYFTKEIRFSLLEYVQVYVGFLILFKMHVWIHLLEKRTSKF